MKWQGLGDRVADLPCEDEALTIFADTVSMHLKPVGRDEVTSMLTVRLRPDNAAHPRNLLLELTDDADLLFYHSLVLGEGEFHTLKSEQRLLVDFQSFPAQLVELLRRCMEAERQARGGGTLSSPTSGLMAPLGTDGARMLACLDCSATGDSTFSIVESTQFRELTHISLRLRQGSDDAVKQHLAGKLRGSRAEASDLEARLRASEASLDQLRRQCDEHATRARLATDERAQLETSLQATHQREQAELREEHLRAVTELQRQAMEERTNIEAELRQSLTQALARATGAERLNTELQHKHEVLATSGKSCQGRLEITESQLKDTTQEVQGLREQTKELEFLKFQYEREIGELKVQVSGLREQLVAKEQLVSNQATQIDQSSAQRRALEEQLTALRQQVVSLEDKFALSAQEISKGNQIIQSLHTNTKQAKAKLRLKATALAQQEKAILEMGKAEEMSKHVLEEKDNELSRARGKEVQLQQDIEELRKKLSEAHDVIKSNQDVIDFLHRQLTDRDLKAIPSAGHASVQSPDLRVLGAGPTIAFHSGLGLSTSAGITGNASNATLESRGLGSLGLASTGLGSTSSTSGTTTATLGGGDFTAAGGSTCGNAGLGTAASPLLPLSASAALTKQVEALLGPSCPSPKCLAEVSSSLASHGALPEFGHGTRSTDLAGSKVQMDVSDWAFAGRENLKGPVAYRTPERTVHAGG